VTDDPERAADFFGDGVAPGDAFPLDRLWISSVNRLGSEINHSIQEWRRSGTPPLGNVYASTELITPLPESPGFSRCHQIDFIEKIDTLDMPVHCLSLLEGDPLILLRNLDTSSGLAKGRRCTAKALRHYTLVVEFDDGTQRVLGRVPIEKVTNGMKFQRWQIPVRLVFAGTVHRSQGMTLSRAVVDYRSQFWEHGQLYVALSRVRQPEDLCLLLPADLRSAPIKVEGGVDVVTIVESMSGPLRFPIGRECLEMGTEFPGPSSSLEAKIEATSDDGIETCEFTMHTVMRNIVKILIGQWALMDPRLRPITFRPKTVAVGPDRFMHREFFERGVVAFWAPRSDASVSCGPDSADETYASLEGQMGYSLCPTWTFI
jgi:hypothetical protein